jgi:hypothetical protein
MVIMMSMMAVVSSTPVVPRVSGATVMVRIRLGIRVVRPLVVSVRIIIIARRIAIIAARKSKTDSANAGKAGGDLSVSALGGNESQSAYRQCNQEKFSHRIFLFCLFPSCMSLCEENGLWRFPLPKNRMPTASRLPQRIKTEPVLNATSTSEIRTDLINRSRHRRSGRARPQLARRGEGAPGHRKLDMDGSASHPHHL